MLRRWLGVLVGAAKDFIGNTQGREQAVRKVLIMVLLHGLAVAALGGECCTPPVGARERWSLRRAAG
jgi:hypothetical protein